METAGRHLPMIKGSSMICPRCKRYHDVLAYDRSFEMIQEYADETNPIVRCPSCRWVFSPGPHQVELQTLISTALEASAA